jgi:hypothetical protein
MKRPAIRLKRTRKRIPIKIEQAVLAKSARRCTLCFGLKRDLREKIGQISHIDGDPSNFGEFNLAWMCLAHHSLFDSKTSQHKNYTMAEVKLYRRRLYGLVARGRHLIEQGSRTSRGSKADRSTLDTILTLVSKSGSMNFLRDNNFAGWSFEPKRLDGFVRFALLRGPEHEFVDKRLERLRKKFWIDCQDLLKLVATHTFPVGTGDRQSVPEEWEIEQPERFQKAVSELHTASDRVCGSYDNLIRTARNQLLP